MTQSTPAKKPDCYPEFEHINRYWDRVNQFWVAKILPGEYYISSAHDEWIATTLGSCVSACIRDRLFGIGGMNHFMLPESNREDGEKQHWNDVATRYGSYAMEHLINDILKRGGRRENLEIKLTGGGKIIRNMSDVGIRNIEFVHRYLDLENLDVNVVVEDLGDIHARKVLYHPSTGRMRVKKLQTLHNETLVHREIEYQQTLKAAEISGSVELF